MSFHSRLGLRCLYFTEASHGTPEILINGEPLNTGLTEASSTIVSNNLQFDGNFFQSHRFFIAPAYWIIYDDENPQVFQLYTKRGKSTITVAQLFSTEEIYFIDESVFDRVKKNGSTIVRMKHGEHLIEPQDGGDYIASYSFSKLS